MFTVILAIHPFPDLSSYLEFSCASGKEEALLPPVVFPAEGPSFCVGLGLLKGECSSTSDLRQSRSGSVSCRKRSEDPKQKKGADE